MDVLDDVVCPHILGAMVLQSEVPAIGVAYPTGGEVLQLDGGMWSEVGTAEEQVNSHAPVRDASLAAGGVHPRRPSTCCWLPAD